MSDEDLRGRFRRDFTQEPIRTGSPRPPKPQKSAAVPAPQQPQSKLAQSTEEDTLASIKPLPQAVSMPKTKRSRRRGRGIFKKLFIFLLVLVFLTAAGYFGYLYKQKQTIVPANIKKEASIPILYPNKLPAGYKIDKNSFSVTQGNLITYYAADTNNNKMVFTVQAKPSNFDFAKFYAQGLTNTNKFTTPLGEGVIGKASGRLVGSLTTGNTWVLISSNSNSVTADKIQYALQNLKVN